MKINLLTKANGGGALYANTPYQQEMEKGGSYL